MTWHPLFTDWTDFTDLTDLALPDGSDVASGAVGCFFTGGEKTGWNYFQSIGDEWKLTAVGDLGDVTVEQIADFNGDGVDDLRIRTAAGNIGAQLVMGADTLEWKYYGSVGAEWKTGLAALS